MSTSDGDPMITSESSAHHPPNLPTPPDLGSPVTVHLPRIEGIRVGHVQKISLADGKVHEMRTLSLKPLLFEIPDFLSEEECRVVVQLAQLKGLTESQAVGPGSQEETADLLELTPEEMFNLLDLNQDGQLQLQEVLANSRTWDGMWLTPESLQGIYAGLQADPDRSGQMSLEEFKHLSNRELWHLPMQPGEEAPGGCGTAGTPGCTRARGTPCPAGTQEEGDPSDSAAPLLVDLSEPMQVVRYEQGGHHHSHHDSGPFHHKAACSHTRLAARVSSLTETFCRYITVLFYLNSVEEGGETTFPVADNRTYNEEALIQENVDLLDTRKSCDKGNLKVKPTQGTAIFWYNHLSDGKGWVGDLDEYSLHGDCVLTRGTKWIANNWINIDPDYQRQARYQKLVSPQREDYGDSGERNPDQHRGFHQDL